MISIKKPRAGQWRWQWQWQWQTTIPKRMIGSGAIFIWLSFMHPGSRSLAVWSGVTGVVFIAFGVERCLAAYRLAKRRENVQVR
jgi:hypothetical protein